MEIHLDVRADSLSAHVGACEFRASEKPRMGSPPWIFEVTVTDDRDTFQHYLLQRLESMPSPGWFVDAVLAFLERHPV